MRSSLALTQLAGETMRQHLASTSDASERVCARKWSRSWAALDVANNMCVGAQALPLLSLFSRAPQNQITTLFRATRPRQRIGRGGARAAHTQNTQHKRRPNTLWWEKLCTRRTLATRRPIRRLGSETGLGGPQLTCLLCAAQTASGSARHSARPPHLSAMAGRYFFVCSRFSLACAARLIALFDVHTRLAHAEHHLLHQH